MKECLCSFLSEASVFPHSSDSGMSRWVGTCRQTAPRAPRSGRGGLDVCHPVSLCCSHPGSGSPGSGASYTPAWALPGNRAAAVQLGPVRAPAGLSPGSYAFAAQAVGSSIACRTQAAPWGIYHLLRSTASATTSFSASICGAESQWRGRWTPRRYYLAA